MLVTDPEQIMIEYGKRKAYRGWATGGIIAVLILFPAFIDFVPVWLTILLSVGVVAGSIAFHVSVWRCPACNSALGRDWDYTFCPHCSARLHL